MNDAHSVTYPQTVRRWDVFEISCNGTPEGNPFTEQTLSAVFHGKNESVTADGFYDGNGVYRVRFMPSFTGDYSFTVRGSMLDEPYTGSFTVRPAGEGNHGPVRVHNTFHFAYEDGVPYYAIGTTCYVWALQSDALIEQTLETLKHSAFNKIRFCVFPKHYAYNLHEPVSYPFAGTPMDSSVLTMDNFNQYDENSTGNDWEFTRFNPAHFRRLENCILKLQTLGIQADIILFHPYDRWGFSRMTAAEDARYLRYVLARFAAYRNVWWSLANEYDLLRHKTLKDWEAIASIICGGDPYRHLRSIHHCVHMYDFSRPWITHCSMQRTELHLGAEYTDRWRDRYQKPVVLDEIAYEGDLPYGWGNLTGEEMLRRFWEGALRGGYPGHGETLLGHENVLWWSHGGKLHGESHKRFKFLLELLSQTPGLGLQKNPAQAWDEVSAIPQEGQYNGQYYLFYYSFMRPSSRVFTMAEDAAFAVTVLDTWNMTKDEKGTHRGTFTVSLPARPYIAVQLKRVDI
ncbi:MAG: DUF5605 domain-containing protein [Clostridiales bacterium]|nr:DUF5605 domain-containing protein [Clostridiales bacterium]